MAVFIRAEWKRYPAGTMAWFNAIHFVDDYGWIVGSRGTILTTEDGGKTWVTSKRFIKDTIRDVYFVDRLHGWLLCEGSVFTSNGSVAYLMVTEDGGVTWKRIDAFEGRDRVVRMFFMNSRFGCAVGEGGAIWCMVENSNNWRKYPLPVRYLILDGRILGHNTLVLVGGGGTALRTEDWGANWIVASVPAAYKSRVNSVFFTDEKHGWSVGASGTILVSKNGGQSWTSQTTPAKAELTDVFFSSPTSGYAVGDKGTILHTTNAGSAWAIEYVETKHRLEAVAATKERVFAVGFGGTLLVREIEPDNLGDIKR